MMYSLPTAPRPMSDVLEDALRLYRASFSRCWSLALLGAVLSAILGLYQARLLGAVNGLGLADLSLSDPMAIDQWLTTLTNRIHPILHSRGLWLSSLALVCVWLVICTALIGRQHEAALGRTDSVGAVLGVALARLPSALVATVVWLLLTVIGMLLLLIPGFWLGGMLQLFLVPLAVEAAGPLKALGRSWRLVERHWWHTSTVLGVAVTLVAVVSMGVDLMAEGLGVNSAGTSLASALPGALLNVFTVPLLTVVMLSLYYDLKLRREGGDLAVRQRSLQRA